jgi:hypothetical protein
MNADAVSVPSGSATPEKQTSSLSRIVRRTHMYLALFLAPWMLMYALSTLAMSHREYVLSFYPTKTPKLTVERELDYSRTFPTNATPDQMGQQILEDLGLDGTHRVSGGNGGKPLVIDRQHALALRRISYDPATRKVSVQREEFRGLTFLERMHRRRGFQHPYALEDSWAFSVDLTVTVMVFWSLSGLWLWWGLRPTRLVGGLCLGFGIALFALFLAMI